jgi:hypothetical protein
MLEKTL